MKIRKVLLRWYKSFNIYYPTGAEPARLELEKRPWNAIDVDLSAAQHYSFIEIPFTPDVTTVVGGNESGKSHLLLAVVNVIKGKGFDGRPFSQADLCRYATVPSDSENRWPNIGLQLDLDDNELARARKILGIDGDEPEDARQMTLIVGTKEEDVEANVYFGTEQTSVTAEQLIELRELLPVVQFIDAKAKLPDRIRLPELLAAFEIDEDEAPLTDTGNVYLDRSPALQIAEELREMDLPAAAQMPNVHGAIEGLKSRLDNALVSVSSGASLSKALLSGVLRLTKENIQSVLSKSARDRGYIEYHLTRWNDSIAEVLDIGHFWQQDDQAKLLLIYKEDTLYFDIIDKTGATYTFEERSSGLRYFLSYYIQAKAIELAGEQNNSVILMDEPDSFLSIIGQRNLIRVFESLVNAESSRGRSQVIYTTHSPFLINRNFPQRIRVVTREEAEEGTQYTGSAGARRYEPVRSALGIDCGQTLFLGATNLVLEGFTDQCLLNELNRLLAAPDALEKVIDLNQVVVVSADSATNVERLLSGSQWNDEVIPATVVLLDGDGEGRYTKKVITGEKQNKKKLIEPEFVVLLSEDIHESLKKTAVRTIEDLVPWPIYRKAFVNYLSNWFDEFDVDSVSSLDEIVAESSDDGIVEGVKSFCEKTDGLTKNYDKMGVMVETIKIISAEMDEPGELDADVKILSERMYALYQLLNEKIEACESQAQKRSIVSNIKRLIRDFLRTRTVSAKTLKLKQLLTRLRSEVQPLKQSGTKLRAFIDELDSEVQALEELGQSEIREAWPQWKNRLLAVKKQPLDPATQVLSVVEDSGAANLAE